MSLDEYSSSATDEKKITVLYFASLSETLDKDQETLTVPSLVKTIKDLKTYLAQRPDPWPELLQMHILCSANQEMSNEHYLIQHGDEIAFFPPVTGG